MTIITYASVSNYEPYIYDDNIIDSPKEFERCSIQINREQKFANVFFYTRFGFSSCIGRNWSEGYQSRVHFSADEFIWFSIVYTKFNTYFI